MLTAGAGQQRVFDELNSLHLSTQNQNKNFASLDCGAKVIETNPGAQVGVIKNTPTHTYTHSHTHTHTHPHTLTHTHTHTESQLYFRREQGQVHDQLMFFQDLVYRPAV